ncbi:hypothetical protein ACSQ67_006147 [Phaseolus vulgaris]
METEDRLSWEKLKRALIARYDGRRLENPFEELSTLRQAGRVEEFVEAFELLSSRVGRLSEEQYLGYFMSENSNPSNRMRMMRMAKDVEEEIKEDDAEGEKGCGEKTGNLSWPDRQKRGALLGRTRTRLHRRARRDGRATAAAAVELRNGGGECEVRRWRNGEQRGFVLSAVVSITQPCTNVSNAPTCVDIGGRRNGE